MTKLGPSLTQTEFARFQAATAQHLSFSLTLACPLRCAHCMVATISPRDAKSATLPTEVATRFAAEMPQVRRAGIRKISFTGGEPLLAREPLAVLSDAAHAAGIATTVVTACHWAKNPKIAARTVAGFPGV
ncbi:MAG: radical SAM protein, partial [Pseudomonadota bacterium]